VTVNNLAIVLMKQRKLEEATRTFERALAGRERALGAAHPRTLDTLDKLVACLREAGDSGRADVLHRSRAGSERSFSQFQTAAELGALALTDHVVDDVSRE
jgi:hypothetical protein